MSHLSVLSMPKRSLLVAVCFVLLSVLPVSGRSLEQAEQLQRLIAQGDLEQALASADQALLGGDGEPEVRFLKGVIEAELGRSDQAVTTFEALVRDHPKLPEPHNNLAVLYAAKGDFDKARDALLQAIAIHPSYAMAHENLGDIYTRMAELSYRRANSLDASNEAARTKLARLEGVLGSNAVAASSASKQAESSPAAVSPSEVVAKTDTSVAFVPAVDAKTLRAAVARWADAWSNQDVDAYLSSYDHEFRPGKGLSVQRWRLQRRQRLTKPSFIKISIDGFEVNQAGPDQARVTFRQQYQSDSYSDSVRKELLLVESEGQWKIRREQSLGTL